MIRTQPKACNTRRRATPTAKRSVLKLRKRWLALVLDGRVEVPGANPVFKTWEIRGSWCYIRGRVELFEVGAKRLRGNVLIVDCFPFTEELRLANHDKHRLSEADYKAFKYDTAYVWVLSSPCRYAVPIEYDGGAGVTWGTKRQLE